ncbi:DUF975 family protein [Roseburia porci]|uniref:DUF975 family protein n=1 Tax=Roseburia porci TaxID=2605790 RepID=UPI0012B33188|nr:DUF975 family protein [Roseburia porci]
MWTRAQVKQRGKFGFRANYWKSVLVAVIISCIAAGSFSFGGAGGSSVTDDFLSDQISKAEDHIMGWDDTDSDDDWDDDDWDDDDWDDDDWDDDDWDDDFMSGFQQGYNSVDGTSDEDFDVIRAGMAALIGFILVFLVIFVVAFAIAFAISAFLLNPLELGCKRFFLRNLNMKAEVKEVCFSFDHSYMNIVKTLFFRDLYTFLWSLLFIIPGIVKAYEYQMIPFLLAEQPDMPKEQAFAISRQMMKGQKWKAFVLDLSFLGWSILSMFTLGILGLFYVNPYKYSTKAALYETLRYGQPADFSANAQMNNMAVGQ